MATSGSYDFSLTAGQIIQAAYEDLGLLEPGETPRAADTTMALARLNMVAKQYQGQADGIQGLKIHTRQRVNLILQKGQQSYLIGPGLTDAFASTTVGKTTLSGNVLAGANNFPITSNKDEQSYPGTTLTMASSDYIGIELDNGAVHWSRIGGTPSTTASVVSVLTGDASAGNHIWWFTDRAQRFPVLESAVLRTVNYEDTALEVFTTVRQYELGVASKLAAGTPIAVLVEPLLTQTRVTFDCAPTDVTSTVVMTVLYPSEDYDSLTDDIAYPQEALRFLSWELAFALSPSFGRWTPEMEQNRKEARAMYQSLNPEYSTLHFQAGGE